MFDSETTTNESSNTSTSSPNPTDSNNHVNKLALLAPPNLVSCMLDDEPGSKKKRKKPRSKNKLNRKSNKSCPKSEWSQLCNFFLATQKETNEHIERMTKLVLGASRASLREDAIEVEYEDIDDGKL